MYVWKGLHVVWQAEILMEGKEKFLLCKIDFHITCTFISRNYTYIFPKKMKGKLKFLIV